MAALQNWEDVTAVAFGSSQRSKDFGSAVAKDRHRDEMVDRHERSSFRNTVHRITAFRIAGAVGEIIQMDGQFQDASLEVIIETHDMTAHHGHRVLGVAVTETNPQRRGALPEHRRNLVGALLPDRPPAVANVFVEGGRFGRSRHDAVIPASRHGLTRRRQVQIKQRRSDRTSDVSRQRPDGVTVEGALIVPACSDQRTINEISRNFDSNA